MKKPTIKYLDSYGNYQYATVKDIGDVEKLTTPIKADLVSAINSIVSEGLGVPQGLYDQVANLDKLIEDIKNGGLNAQQLAQLQEAIRQANAQIKVDFDELDRQMAQAKIDYDKKVEDIKNTITGVENNLTSSGLDLEATKKKLTDVELGVTKVETAVDEVKGVLLSKVNSAEFALLESTVTDNTTLINQTAEGLGLMATKESLNLATGDIAKLQADFGITAEAIKGTVKKSELIGELEGLDIYPANLLTNTREWRNWQSTVLAKAYVLSETYQNAKIQEQIGFNSYLKNEIKDLKIGKTYAVSVWAKSSQLKAKPVFKIGTKNYAMTNNNTGDEFLSDIWQRYSGTFVAEVEKETIAFTTTGTVNGDIVQFSGGKVEVGTKSTGWREHVEDTHGRLTVSESFLRQTADSLATVVTKQEKIGDDVLQQETQINQLSDSVSLNANKLEKTGKDITRLDAQFKVQSDLISAKVEKTDINKAISDIKLDNRNAIINSDFFQDFENWESVSSVFKIIELGKKKYAQATRSGLSRDLIASITSNATSVAVGQRVMIGMDIIVADITAYDSRTVFALELLDKQDIRVGLVEFKLEDLDTTLQSGIPKRLSTAYRIEREDVFKARLRLTLYRNGTVSYTNVLLQKGDIGSTDWTPAPEDSQIVTAKLATEVTQTAEELKSKAGKDVVDSLTGEFLSLSSEYRQTAEEITTTVTSYTNKVTGFEKTLGVFEEKIESTLYTWIMWADDALGSNMSSDSLGKKFIGIAHNKPTPEPPLGVLPSEFEWTNSTGEDGKDGVNGEDAFRVEVLSTNGNTFKNGVIQTSLSAVIYKGDKDITDTIDASRVRWTRTSRDEFGDEAWNSKYFGGTKKVNITTDDVRMRATFTVDILK